MSRSVVTGVVAVLLTAVGFVGGGAGAAYQWRESHADPWRKLEVEHEGIRGAATRTRVTFKNPALAIQAVEVLRDAEEKPELAHVVLQDGSELTAHYEGDTRPTRLEAPDGSAARLEYGSASVHVTLVGADGADAGKRSIHAPLQLRSPLHLAYAGAPAAIGEDEGRGVLATISEALVGDAWAAEGGTEAASEDEAITVRRDVTIRLGARLAPGKDVAPGPARLEASCAPFTCLPARPEVATPSEEDLRVIVSGVVPKRSLGEGPDAGALEPFVAIAKGERKQAKRVLGDVAAAVSAVGVTALACRSIGAESSVCVKGLGKTGSGAAGAIVALLGHEVSQGGPVVDERARTLWFEDRARAALDKTVNVEVCLTRDRYARACVGVEGRPFAGDPMPRADRAVDLKRRVGATLAGTFVVTQSDGGDCKFSPSPRTAGPLTIGIDSERGTVTASFRGDERGTRPDLGCSLGTANMSWSQTYTVTASQTFTSDQLTAGGKLQVRLVGTMTGSGTYSFSNCRTAGGGSAACPGGKTEPYSYPVDLTGEVDLDSGKGGGNIIVRNAPLSTSGTWTTTGEK